jgi:HSP20 family protein
MLTPFRSFDHTFGLLDREMARAFAPQQRVARTSVPRIDLFEGPASFLLQAEVPGAKLEDIEVLLDDEGLEIRGAKKTDVPEGFEARFSERVATEFSRKFALGAKVDASGVTATLKDGVLTVTVPKAEDATPRAIPIQTG